jgi:hypothetical protein
MAYVGTPIDTQNQFQSLQGKRFSGDASTTAFTLDIAPSSVFDIEVFVENVRQDPNSAYTLNGTTLTFTGTPPSGTNNIYVVHQAKAVGTIDVPASGVVPASLASNIISGQTELAATPADTDELLISDAGTIKRIDYSYIKPTNTPNFSAVLGSNQTVANATATKLLYNTEEFDSGSCYDASNSKFVVPSGEGGKYLFTAQFEIDTIDDGERVELKVYKNNSEDNRARQFQYTGSDGKEHFIHNSFLLNLSAADYIEIYTQHNVGQNRTYYASHTRFSGFKLIE